MEQIGNKIKKYREIKNLSQNLLGKMCNINQSKISKIEKNKTPITIDELFKISEALDIDVCDVLPCKYSKLERQFLEINKQLFLEYYRNLT